jgi:5-methylcytosine-specific restriction endonuclease McrA
MYRNLSSAEKEQAVSLYKSGLSSPKVAAIMGCSVSGVSSLLRKEGLSRPRTQTHLLGAKMPSSHVEKTRKRMTGNKHSLRTRLRMSEAHRKRLKDYIRKEPQNKLIRKSIEYKLWREAVYKRDNYTCQICYKRGSITLNADHIKPFALYPKLRFSITNGRTLCIECHRATPTFGANSRQKVIA